MPLTKSNYENTSLSRHAIFLIKRFHLVKIAYLVSSIAILEQLIVDNTRLDGVDQVNDGSGCGNLRVLEAMDLGFFASRGKFLVNPGDDLLLDFCIGRLVEAGQHGQSVGSHELPDQSQSQGRVPLIDVLAGDADEAVFLLPADVNGIVAVLELLHELFHSAELPSHFVPLHRTRVDDFVELKNDEPIRQIGGQTIHIRGDAE